MVVMKGKNDDEVVALARLAREQGYEVRFIEFMPLDGDNIWTNEQVVPSLRIQEQIEDLFPLRPVADPRPGPATRYKFADGSPGGIGFISSVSQAFCTTCNRIRLTAEGGLRTCLFSLQETPLRDLMRSGVSDDHLGRVIETAVWRKEEGHLINQPGFIKPAKNMSQIGGWFRSSTRRRPVSPRSRRGPGRDGPPPPVLQQADAHLGVPFLAPGLIKGR